MEALHRKKITCRNLMLNHFMDALIDNDMSIVGEDWEDILKEYSNLSAIKSYNATPLLWRDINYLQIRLTITDMAIYWLNQMPPLPKPELDPFKEARQQFVQILANYDYDLDFDTAETFAQNIEAVITRSQTERLELEQKLDDWSGLHKHKQKQGENTDYVTFFDSWLEAISTNFPVTKETIDVHSFCVRTNKVFKKIETDKIKKSFNNASRTTD